MSDSYLIRINRKDGALEVAAPEKAWVDEKLAELSAVFESWDPAGSQPEMEESPPQPKRGEAPARKVERKSRGRRTTARAEKNPELDVLLTKEVRDKFERYVSEREPSWSKSRSAQAAIIATFLADELDWPGVDPHDLYTVYTAMGYPTPGNMRSQLVNARQRDKYFRGIREGKAELSHAGENFARHEAREGDTE